MSNLASQLQGPWFNGLHTEAIALFWSECDATAAVRLKPHAPLIEAMVSSAPYLRQLLRDHAGFAALCLESSPQEIHASLCARCAAAAFLDDLDQTAAELRKAKAQMALLLALADIGHAWDVDQVTRALTEFADAAVKAAVNALLLEAHGAGKLMLADPKRPSSSCGYVVLAMGKHGAFELNYSSDIDLIVLFDPETAPVAPGEEAANIFIRMTKKLVNLLQDVTVDGYIFRTDLRLRPDPRATQVAIAVEAAAHYYENLGQNWERAAYIKARAAAGDIALGEAFLARLRPYVWRKYLDFASIADVQSLIRQIHAVKGHGEVAVEGHNLKLGRGGIREIEFFVQTQQLIAGGRHQELRGRSTIAMLAALADAGWITHATASDMQDCYRFLRMLEHRAQMVDDQQTHQVPAEHQAFENYARFSGFADGTALAERLRATLELVKAHSSKLFAESGALGGEQGSLVFTGGEDDPETLETLKRMGFVQASEVSAIIRGWHFGRYPATRTRAARERLTELMPALLKALANSGDADRTFIDFDGFLAGLPAGVQLFSMLKANEGLLNLITRILGTAPRLAEGMSRRPRVLEAVLEPGFFGPLPPLRVIRETADELIPAKLPFEEAMDRARVLGREQQFRVGVRVLTDTLTAEEAGSGFANVADVLIGKMLDAALADMEARHGRFASGRVAVIAMGKLGGREMTANSDLDLVFVYDEPAEGAQSDGARPLSPQNYYTRLTQRFISALTVPTAEGSLYEVDMRLRPSGSKGPVAVSFSSFKTYQAESAWTWEKLALTRARPIAGDVGLMAELRTDIAASLGTARDESTARKDVVDMRRLMLREHKPASLWDIKRVRGGLVELEFIAQFLQIIHANRTPGILHSNTAEALVALRDHHLLEPGAATELLEAFQLFHRLTQVLRLCLEGLYSPEKALPGLNRSVMTAAGVPSIAAAEDLLRQHQAKVSGHFDRLVGSPE